MGAEQAVVTTEVEGRRVDSFWSRLLAASGGSCPDPVLFQVTT